MRLEKASLHPFAGISSAEISFQPGLNVIVGPNEAGKTTLFNAILSSLFTHVQLTKPAFAAQMQRFIPIDGDTASVELRFSRGTVILDLGKTWGPTKSASLTMQDGTLITDDARVADKLNELLPASEGTFRSVLTTYQSGLQSTIDDLNKEDNAGTIQSIGDILRSALLQTDGVSVEGFKKLIAAKHSDYFGRWDAVHSRPEGGRGIENKWVKGAGLIVQSYYRMEEDRKALQEATEYEEAYDTISRQISILDISITQKRDYINQNTQIVQDARERRTLEAEIKALGGEIDRIKSANRDWPVAISKIAELNSQLTEMSGRLTALQQERISTEKVEKSRGKREKLQRATVMNQTLSKAIDELESTKKVTREQLDALVKAAKTVENLLAAISAGRVTAKLHSTNGMKISVQTDFSPPIETKLMPDEEKLFEAGGSIIFSNPDWKLQLSSGNVSFEENEKKYHQANDSLKQLLADCDLSSLEQAHDANQLYERRVQAAENARANLQAELGNETLETLQEEITAAGETSSARTLADVVKDLVTVQKDVDSKEKELAQYEATVGSFERVYKSPDDLLMDLATRNQAKVEKEKNLSALAPLPPEITDFEKFIKRYEDIQAALGNETDKRNLLSLQRATLEGKSPDLSLEELQSKLDESTAQYQGVLRTGNAIEKILKATNALLAQIDTGTYDGLKEDVAKYMSKLTSDKYSQIEAEEVVPSGLITATGKVMPGQRLSTGTLDALGLSLRLAMANYFLRDSNGFVMMDDPLVNFDPERQQNAAEVLQAFAEKKQLIIFTCHPEHATLLGGYLTTLH